MAVLSEVIDGVTPVDETHPEEVRAAFGATWDSATDLTVKQISDGIQTPGNGLAWGSGNLAVSLAANSLLEFSSGGLRVAAAAAGDGIQGGGGSTLAVDVSDFAGAGLEDDGSENLRIAAAAAGDGIQGGAGSALAVDVSDFAGAGLEDDGSENLRIAAAAAGDGIQGGAGSALAVDVSDFAGAGLEDDGSENLRIATTAAGSGLTGGGGSALAVNYDNSTLGVDGSSPPKLIIKSGGVDVAQMAASALSGYGNTASRPAASKAGFTYYNTQRAVTERDSGSTYNDCGAWLSATQRDDLTDGGETTLHTHAAAYAKGARTVIYADATQGGASGVAAAALPVYSYQDPESVAEEVKLRAAYFMDPAQGHIRVDCQAQYDVAPSGSTHAHVSVSVAKSSDGTTLTAEEQISSTGSYAAESVAVTLTGWTEETILITVSISWASEAHAGDNPVASMRYVSIEAY